MNWINNLKPGDLVFMHSDNCAPLRDREGTVSRITKRHIFVSDNQFPGIETRYNRNGVTSCGFICRIGKKNQHSIRKEKNV